MKITVCIFCFLICSLVLHAQELKTITPQLTYSSPGINIWDKVDRNAICIYDSDPLLVNFSVEYRIDDQILYNGPYIDCRTEYNVDGTEYTYLLPDLTQVFNHLYFTENGPDLFNVDRLNKIYLSWSSTAYFGSHISASEE